MVGMRWEHGKLAEASLEESLNRAFAICVPARQRIAEITSARFGAVPFIMLEERLVRWQANSMQSKAIVSRSRDGSHAAQDDSAPPVALGVHPRRGWSAAFRKGSFQLCGG